MIYLDMSILLCMFDISVSFLQVLWTLIGLIV